MEKLKGRHREISSIALADIDLAKVVLEAVERKQAKEQEKEQKEFELIIAEKDVEIARRRAKGEGDAIRIRSEGKAEGVKIRANVPILLNPRTEHPRASSHEEPNGDMRSGR